MSRAKLFAFLAVPSSVAVYVSYQNSIPTRPPSAAPCDFPTHGCYDVAFVGGGIFGLKFSPTAV